MGWRCTAAVSVALLTLFGCGSTGSTTGQTTAPGQVQTTAVSAAASATATTTDAATTATTLAAVKVLGLDSTSVAALQRYADDVAAGRISTIVTQCWTVAPERIRQTFTEDGRRTFLKAVGARPTAGQYGIEWSAGDTFVNVSWAELDSSYACPHVTGGATPDFPAAMDATLVAHRLDARLKGSPVNAKDTQKNYPLLCDTFGAESGAADAPEATLLTAAQKTALAALATSTTATFSAQSESQGVLRIGTDNPSMVVRLEADLCVDSITA